jgi:hypothetical protein
MAGLSGLASLQLNFQQLQLITATTFAAACVKAGLPVPSLGELAPMGAVFNATDNVLLAVQNLANYVAGSARLTTSVDEDVISFISPFIGAPEGQTYSTGVLTYTLPSVVNAVTIAVAVGAIIQSADGTLQFQVISDVDNPNFNQTTNAYYVPAMANTTLFSVMCLTAGTIGNVPADSITVPYTGFGVTGSTIQGTVTNAEPLTNAQDSESIPDYIVRFQDEMAGGSVGTSRAILAAVRTFQDGLAVQIGDGLNPAGAPTTAYFTVFVNVYGQSAGPSSELITQIHGVVDAIRAAGILFTVVSPTLLDITVSGIIHGDGTTTIQQAITNAQAAAAAYINNLQIWDIQTPNLIVPTTIPISLVSRAIQAASGVDWIDNLQLNGSYGSPVAGYGVQPIFIAANFTSE